MLNWPRCTHLKIIKQSRVANIKGFGCGIHKKAITCNSSHSNSLRLFSAHHSHEFIWNCIMFRKPENKLHFLFLQSNFWGQIPSPEQQEEDNTWTQNSLKKDPFGVKKTSLVYSVPLLHPAVCSRVKVSISATQACSLTSSQHLSEKMQSPVVTGHNYIFKRGKLEQY